MTDDGSSLVRRAEWVKLVSYGSGFEAQLAVAALAKAGIPALVRDHGAAGIFGAGFAGRTPLGVELLVPSSALEEAWTVLLDGS